MPNNRIFYASHGVSVNGTGVQGAQSVGVTTNFNLEQAFQLGQVALYDNIVVDPEVEVTVSKVLDGRDTIWKLATGGGSLITNANDTASIVIAVGDDTAATLTNTAGVTCTGMVISSLSYNFPVDGNFTEEVTFVGNSKSITGTVSAPANSTATVLRRQHFLTGSTLPSEVSGKNITNITINASLGRDTLYKLGQYAPYHRFVNFPLEVTCEFEVTPTGVDGVVCDPSSVSCTGGNLPAKQPISIQLCDADGASAQYTFNLGSNNRLQSVTYNGGDTGGGNVTTTFSYSTYNELDITG